jgi:hypothetical protein
MTVIIISIVAAWILFSALLVTIICMNSSRLSRIDEPFKDPAELAQERREKREEYAQSAVQIGAET